MEAGETPLFLAVSLNSSGLVERLLARGANPNSSNAQGNLTGYTHGFEFGGSANGVSFGRVVTTDSVAHPTNAIALAPVLAAGLSELLPG